MVTTRLKPIAFEIMTSFTTTLYLSDSELLYYMLNTTQQFGRPIAGHYEYRIQSRTRVDNDTAIVVILFRAILYENFF